MPILKPELANRKGSVRLAQRAFTLVECLSVIAIILIIATILFPTLSSGKRSAAVTEDKAKLHQVALASQLYSENNGRYPDSLETLISSKHVLAEQCVSKLDHFPDGISNAYQRLMDTGSRGTKDRISFFSIATFRMTQKYFEEEQQRSTNVGHYIWPLDFPHSTNPETIDLVGSYLRVTDEGSVIKRSFAPVNVRDAQGNTAPWTNFHFFFGDPDAETKKRWEAH